MSILIDLISRFGLWIALAVVFLTMHWFGLSCCGAGLGHRTPRVRPGSSQDGPESGAAGKKGKEEA